KNRRVQNTNKVAPYESRMMQSPRRRHKRSLDDHGLSSSCLEEEEGKEVHQEDIKKRDWDKYDLEIQGDTHSGKNKLILIRRPEKVHPMILQNTTNTGVTTQRP